MSKDKLEDSKSKMQLVMDGLRNIQDSESIATLPEVIEALNNLIEEHDLMLDDILEWYEEDPEAVAYLMKYGTVEQQEFGTKLQKHCECPEEATNG